MSCFIFFHRWCKWEEFKEKVPAQQLTQNYYLSATIDTYQKRTCENCGKTQIVKIHQQLVD